MRRPASPGPVVVKIGSSSLTVPEGGGIDTEALERVVAQVAGVRGGGRRAVLVSSGAVAAGLPALSLRTRPSDIPGLQVAAAVGQGRLMERYTTCFAAYDLVCGQVLLTREGGETVIRGERFSDLPPSRASILLEPQVNEDLLFIKERQILEDTLDTPYVISGHRSLVLEVR